MRLVMTITARNEADIIDSWVDYHFARGVDALVVTDNGSTDGTRDLLERRRRESPDQILVFDEPYAPSSIAQWPETQSRLSTGMARLAHDQLGADWVLNADADEFYWPEGGSLKEILEAVPSRYGALKVPVADFVLRPGDSGLFADRMVARRARTFKPAGKSVQTTTIHRARADVVVSSGNHRVEGDGLPYVPAWQPVTALHFPYRTRDQLERKMAWKRHRPEWQYADDPDDAISARMVDDDALAEGIREGRLLIDDRLKRFLAGRDAGSRPDNGGAMAWPELPPAVAELRADLERAVWIQDTEEAGLRRKVQTLEDRVASQRAALEGIRDSPWWRFGQRLRGVRGHGRPTSGDR